MRVAIIGGGAVGSMAAWRIAEAGHAVTVFEQFKLDHDRGSSYGDSRVVRRVYSDPFYTTLMADAYRLWEELQARYPQQELFAPIGGVFFGPEDHLEIRAAGAALAGSSVEHEVLDRSECQQRFPALTLRAGEVALYEPGMGYVRASHCVRAAMQLAIEAGATLLTEVTVTSVRPTVEALKVTIATGATFSFDRVLLCAGPWTAQITRTLGLHLPLKVVRKTYVHLQPAHHHEEFEVGRFPVWIDANTWAYGFPHLGDVPGVKIAIHAGGEVTTPETAERTLGDNDRAPLLDIAASRFPNLSKKIVYEKVCLYTNTPDEDFIVDAVPGADGAYIIGGTSGHGFKFTPLLGQVALELITGASLRYDLSRFALNRFAP